MKARAVARAGLYIACFMVVAGVLVWPFVAHLLQDRVFDAERVARGFLYSIWSREIGLAMESGLDADGDGIGEFGTLRDIMDTGSEYLDRSLEQKVVQFDRRLNEVEVRGRYLAKVFVPVETDLAERAWCAVAWPLKQGAGGVRHAFVRTWLSGDPPSVFRGRSDAPRFSGWGNGPVLDDIFEGEPFQSRVREDVWQAYP